MHYFTLKKYLALFFAFCCAACSPGYRAGPPGASAVASVSRVVIPANGGQTIQEPRNMGDTFTLWGPPGRSYSGRVASGPSAARAQRGVPGAALATGATRTTGAALATGATQTPGVTRAAGEAGETGLAAQNVPAWLPATEQEIMRRYLYRFTHEQKELAARVLARAKIHLPVALEEVTRRGLPPELACLPLVESAFEPSAVSRAGAAGLWQLMPETARRFGLVVNSELDERFDVRKSTEAATAYLAYLYGLFKDWPLALAAYNCGEGAMLNAMGKANCENLGSLTAYCRATENANAPLREETLRFVPQFAAAVLLMTKAEEFGFGPIMPPEAANLSRMAILKSAEGTPTEGTPRVLNPTDKTPTALKPMALKPMALKPTEGTPMNGTPDKTDIAIQPFSPARAGSATATEIPGMAGEMGTGGPGMGGDAFPTHAASKQNLPEKLALSGRYESGPQNPPAQPPRSMRMQ